MPRKNPAAYRRLNPKPKAAGKPIKRLIWRTDVAHGETPDDLAESLHAVLQAITDEKYYVSGQIPISETCIVVSAYLSQWGTPEEAEAEPAAEGERES